MKIKNLLVSGILMSAVLSMTAQAEVKVGIVLPMEHAALDEIVKGFQTSLQKQYRQPITFKVLNAQNDQNVQHAILQQMQAGDYDLVVPVATGTSEMAISIIKNKPIVSLATDIPESVRQKLNPCNVAVVDDEVSSQTIVHFIHEAYPQMKNMVLIHSASEKVLPEVADAQRAAKKAQIDMKDVTIQNLMDLQNVAHHLPTHTQGIFVLKDNLVVSGIAQLASLAKEKHIPLITSDEGSVEQGADFAVGVRESQIGVEGAELALQILNGKKACHLPIKKMETLFVFVNEKSMQKKGESFMTILNAAKKLHDTVVLVK